MACCAVELCDLEWSQVEFDRNATLHVRRAKNGKPAAHPIRGDELRALRELQRQTSGGYVFETERGTPFKPCQRGVRNPLMPCAQASSVFILCSHPLMRTRGDMLRYGIAFALRAASKLVRGLRQGLTEDE